VGKAASHPPDPPQPDVEAVIIVAASHGKQLVVQACARAHQVGVRPGMTLAHARAQLHGRRVHVADHTPADDARGLQKLARWMHRFSPIVAADEPDGVVADLTGCERVFGGWPALLDKLHRSLEALGLHARTAIAPTFGCAWAVARYGRSARTIVPPEALHDTLTALPIEGLRIEPRIRTALADVAVERIGQLIGLPRAELAARFGKTLLDRLDEAFGAKPETITPLQPAHTDAVDYEFTGPVADATIVRNTVEKMLNQLLDRLERRGHGLVFLRITFRRSDLPPTVLTLPLTYPTRDERHLSKLLEPQLERVHLGHGVIEIRLAAERTAPLVHQQLPLLPGLELCDLSPGATLGALLDQLTNRLGRHAVTTIQSIETYVPERAFAVQPLNDAAAHRPSEAAAYPAPRPSRLFVHPQPVRVIALLPDSPPAWIQSGEHESRVRTDFGPERIALPWWSDDRPSTRDYFAVQTDAGRWLWLFRQRDSGAWFIHGEWS